MSEETLLKITVVAEKLNCSKRKVWQLISEGHLEKVLIGPRCARIRSNSLIELISKGVGND